MYTIYYMYKIFSEILQCLLYLTIIFSEKGRLFYPDIQQNNNIYILFNNEEIMFYLYVQNQHILSHEYFHVVFISFYCSLYIYNISYPNNIKLTLSFIQKIIFDLQDDVNIF